MDRSTQFIAAFAPLMLFSAGGLVSRQEWWDALLCGCMGIACYLTIVRDLKRALAAGGKEGRRG